ncbi:unnamed protein product [Pylaiella littoralis]
MPSMRREESKRRRGGRWNRLRLGGLEVLVNGLFSGFQCGFSFKLTDSSGVPAWPDRSHSEYVLIVLLSKIMGGGIVFHDPRRRSADFFTICIFGILIQVRGWVLSCSFPLKTGGGSLLTGGTGTLILRSTLYDRETFLLLFAFFLRIVQRRLVFSGFNLQCREIWCEVANRHESLMMHFNLFPCSEGMLQQGGCWILVLM